MDSKNTLKKVLYPKREDITVRYDVISIALLLFFVVSFQGALYLFLKKDIYGLCQIIPAAIAFGSVLFFVMADPFKNMDHKPYAVRNPPKRKSKYFFIGGIFFFAVYFTLHICMVLFFFRIE